MLVAGVVEALSPRQCHRECSSPDAIDPNLLVRRRGGGTNAIICTRLERTRTAKRPHDRKFRCLNEPDRRLFGQYEHRVRWARPPRRHNGVPAFRSVARSHGNKTVSVSSNGKSFYFGHTTAIIQ